MRRLFLPLLLASAITLTPSRARADSSVMGDMVGSVFQGLLILAAAAAVTVTAVEVMTGVASYKNYRSWKDERDPAAGWVGVGGVGGLFNLGLGAYFFVDGLPADRTYSCGEASGPPRHCDARTPASPGQLIFGTLLTGFGAFSLTMAIQAARTSAPQATGTNAAPLTASVGFMLPPLRF